MVNNKVPTFPLPNDDAKQQSDALLSHILDEIHKKGRISFAEYMNLALYTPKLGYYTGGCFKFGSQGDFVTAPEISDLFSKCLAKNFITLDEEIGTKNEKIETNLSILEFGAGSGKMAVDIMLELEKHHSLPKHYYILEISSELKDRQKQTIETYAPHLQQYFIFLETLENFKMDGLILANEVLDAMPVRTFSVSNNEIHEFFVTEKNDQLIFEKGIKNRNCSTENYIRSKVLPQLQFSDNQNETVSQNKNTDAIFEVNKLINPWIKSLSQILNQGAVLILDYGFPRHELYHPDRSMGTLMCHYRHQAHHDPFLFPGLQDITAHVDFTLVAESAIESGFEILGFTNQASFLINSGLIDLITQTEATLNLQDQIKQNHAIQILSSPSEMGEIIKAMALSKNISFLPGFTFNNQLHRL